MECEMKIDAVFFDMGGTIDLYPWSENGVINSCAKMKKILEAAGADQICKLSDNEFRDMIFKGIKKYKNWRKADETELSSEKVFNKFVLADIGVAEKIINAVGEELAFLIETGFHERYPRPEAGEVLNLIKERGLKLGIISNVISRTQVGFCLEKYGLNEYFDTIVLSSVFGKRKPHPAIFHHACNEAGISPANLIFVGNSPANDIAGAKNAGVAKTVYIEYAETSAEEMGVEAADYSIKDLRELISIIDGLSGAEN